MRLLRIFHPGDKYQLDMYSSYLQELRLRFASSFAAGYQAYDKMFRRKQVKLAVANPMLAVDGNPDVLVRDPIRLLWGTRDPDVFTFVFHGHKAGLCLLCGSPHHMSEDHVEVTPTKKKNSKRPSSGSDKPTNPTPTKRPKYELKLSDGSQVCLAYNKLGKNKKGCSRSGEDCRFKHVCANCRGKGHNAGNCSKPVANRAPSRD